MAKIHCAAVHSTTFLSFCANTPVCFSKLGSCQLPSTVGYTPTINEYLIQPCFRKYLFVWRIGFRLVSRVLSGHSLTFLNYFVLQGLTVCDICFKCILNHLVQNNCTDFLWLGLKKNNNFSHLRMQLRKVLWVFCKVILWHVTLIVVSIESAFVLH